MREKLIKYDINPQKVVTFGRALELLKQPDTIGIDEIALNGFHQMAAHYGVAPEKMQRFTIDQWQFLILYLNIDLKNIGCENQLAGLTRDHAYMTFIEIVYPVLLQQQNLREDFYNKVKRI